MKLAGDTFPTSLLKDVLWNQLVSARAASDPGGAASS
jgi:hypothetical protein